MLASLRQQFSYLSANVVGKQIITTYERGFDKEWSTGVISELVRLTK